MSFTAISVVAPKFGLSSLANAGPHGLSEIFYAYAEAGANNGSAFAGLSANTLWYNTTIAATMLFGRFFMVIPVLAIAGNLVQKKHVPETSGTFPVTTPLFTGLADLRDRHRRRADIFPGAQPGPDSRAPADVRGQDFLRTPNRHDCSSQEKQIDLGRGHRPPRGAGIRS